MDEQELNKMWAYLRHVGNVTDAVDPERFFEDYYDADLDYGPEGDF